MASNQSKRKWRERGFVAAQMILPLISFCVFFIYQTVEMLLLAFQRYDLKVNDYVFTGWNNFHYIFTSYSDPERKTAAWNTFFNMFHAWIINPILVPVIIIVSYSFFKKIKFEKFFRVAYMMPGIVSAIVTTMCWKHLFSYDFGPLKKLFSYLLGKDIIFQDTTKNYLWWVVYAYCIWAGLGSHVIMISGAMLRIPEELQDAGQIDGLGFWGELFKIVLPLSMGTISMYLIAIISSPLSFGTQVMFLVPNAGPDNKYYTFAWMMFDSMKSGLEQNLPMAAAWGLLYTVLWFPLMWIGRKGLEKITPDVDF